jgi:hypothetical protein
MRTEWVRRIDECESCEPVPNSHDNIFRKAQFQNRYRLSLVSSERFRSQEIVMVSRRRMASSRNLPPISLAAFATAFAAACLLWANAALASQGPGGGPGAASSFTQLAMAIIVYGTSALLVGIGLIGAARRR